MKWQQFLKNIMTSTISGNSKELYLQEKFSKKSNPDMKKTCLQA